MEAINKNSKPISKELFHKIQNGIEQYMIEKKGYLKQDLSMHQLAKEINSNTSYLSRIIRETHGTNFSTYLNSLRISEAKQIMMNKEFNNYSIDAISKESGYINKSTFYKAFKNITGVSPNNYRKKINKQF